MLFKLARVHTPSSLVREKEGGKEIKREGGRKRERGRERVRKRKRKREGEGEKERDAEYGYRIYFIAFNNESFTN